MGLFIQMKSRFFQQKVRGCQALRVALCVVPAAPGDRHSCDNTNKSF